MREQHVRCRRFQQPADRHQGRRSFPSPACPSNPTATVLFGVHLNHIELRVYCLNDLPLSGNALATKSRSRSQLFRHRHRHGPAQAFLIKTGLQFLRRRINLTLSHTTDVNHRAPVFGLAGVNCAPSRLPRPGLHHRTTRLSNGRDMLGHRQQLRTFPPSPAAPRSTSGRLSTNLSSGRSRLRLISAAGPGWPRSVPSSSGGGRSTDRASQPRA